MSSARHTCEPVSAAEHGCTRSIRSRLNCSVRRTFSSPCRYARSLVVVSGPSHSTPGRAHPTAPGGPALQRMRHKPK
eukprot:354068-Chlamydomonas_euryale.AAC.3